MRAAAQQAGQQIVDRAVKKGTVGGDVGMQLVFEPAMLLSLVADGDAIYELASIAKDVPIIGNYNQWLPASSTIAAAYRVLIRVTTAAMSSLRTTEYRVFLASIRS